MSRDFLSVIKDVLKSVLGNFSSREERIKFFFLGFIFALTVGIYWFLRTSKDGVFDALVGFDYQPVAKWVSLVFIIPLSMIYGYLVDHFPRHRIFYALSTIYASGCIFFTYALTNSTYGLGNSLQSPYRMLGWAYYLFVESFGSLLPVLFWAFAADTTSPESAKKGFPFVAFIAQFGVWLGCAVNAGRFGDFAITTTLFGAAVGMMMIPLAMYWFMSIMPSDQLKSYSSDAKDSSKSGKKTASFMESARLVFSQPYLLGILFSIVIYEVVNTLFDFRFKSLVSSAVQTYVIENNIPVDQIGAVKTTMFNQWTGSTGEWMAIVGIVSYLLGLNRLAQRFGFAVSLLILPVLIGIVSFILYGFTSLMVASVAVILTKGINYTLYQPLKEQLYIPTSKEAKWKSKTLIDMFGSRGSKASGSLINFIKIYAPGAFPLIFLSSSVALCLVWFMISTYLGKTYENATKKNEIVC